MRWRASSGGGGAEAPGTCWGEVAGEAVSGGGGGAMTATGAEGCVATSGGGGGPGAKASPTGYLFATTGHEAGSGNFFAASSVVPFQTPFPLASSM